MKYLEFNNSWKQNENVGFKIDFDFETKRLGIQILILDIDIYFVG